MSISKELGPTLAWLPQQIELLDDWKSELMELPEIPADVIAELELHRIWLLKKLNDLTTEPLK